MTSTISKLNISNWICCQIGAREHYAIPRALHENGQLTHLITDAWVTPQSPLAVLPFSPTTALKERFHPTLQQASVHAFNLSLIGFEISQKLQKTSAWERMIARNYWFQHQAIKRLTKLAPHYLKTPPILFSYSYAALEIFRFAKQQGWLTILGQIDPGPLEEEIVIAEYQRYPQYRGNWEPVPASYWETWREECALADCILVNSHWSRQLLEKAGINSEKIQVVPLVYTPPTAAKNFNRTYPQSFSPERPLRVLFLGQVILRKGIAAVLSAVEKLSGYPIEFWIVGSQQINIPPHLKNHPQIRWVGHVNRSETAKYYQQADVFLFPTLSDGFGLTQLEAQAWKLPIVASQQCGEVVHDDINGLLLKEDIVSEIVDFLLLLKNNPQKIRVLSKKIVQNNNYSLKNLMFRLNSIL
ncbi:glycosyltransferase family 4 protein [Picosynechococcus sp. PCC 11901]|uniref:glycosyltransferase family 4 protein n=1 Tax=Picosynechococcus sp. PCC 11901 TaxID=2579791 RepID=UPI0010FC2C5D|nr:glycosyltransferase family 4 protein [Picosynechococcus sp. PCC 11901]QCS50069.1 glycosyltransferase family 4 protein [Picosynechococcus sp. PCC 11901]